MSMFSLVYLPVAINQCFKKKNGISSSYLNRVRVLFHGDAMLCYSRNPCRQTDKLVENTCVFRVLQVAA